MQVCPKCNGKTINQEWVSGEGEAINFGVENKSDNRKLFRGEALIKK